MKKLLILFTLGLMFGQTEWTTRIYTIENYTFTTGQSDDRIIYVNEITGYELDYAMVKLIATNNVSGQCDFCEGVEHYTVNLCGGDGVGIGRVGEGSWFRSSGYTISVPGDGWFMFTGVNGTATADITFSVTAEFPIEDTGYMEEDFDFCINEGFNLISYPCENTMAINDAIPFDILNNLTSIVGAGEAGANINDTWVGSLDSLSAGSGFWFNSNIEACFNYECAEN